MNVGDVSNGSTCVGSHSCQAMMDSGMGDVEVLCLKKDDGDRCWRICGPSVHEESDVNGVLFCPYCALDLVNDEPHTSTPWAKDLFEAAIVVLDKAAKHQGVAKRSDFATPELRSLARAADWDRKDEPETASH